MKLNHFSLFLLLISLYFSASSQEIQNHSFENWFSQQYYEDPDGFASTNFASYITTGEPNVLKSTDAYTGSYAVKMETVPSSEGDIAGALFIGAIGDGYIAGGIPFDERPDSVTGYVKYDVLGMDTANIVVLFKKFGAPLGLCLIQFTGTQNDYVYFSAPVQWLAPIVPPDSLATGISSSTVFGIPEAGSTITVDNIGFVGANASFPNFDFEDWTQYSSEEPEDWFTSNFFNFSIGTSSVSKTEDSYDGDFAIKMVNTVSVWDDTLGLITNGTFGAQGPIKGMPIDSIPDKLSGYYKYEPVGSDTALARMALYYFNETTGNTEKLDDRVINLPPASEYTYFEIESNYYSLPEPDTLNIAFASGNFIDEGAYIGLGSTLYIDALEITYKPHIVGIGEEKYETIHHVYPNPASDQISFEFQDVLKNEITVTISDSKGVLVYQTKYMPMSMKQFDISVNEFLPGIYFYMIESQENSYKGKFIVE